MVKVEHYILPIKNIHPKMQTKKRKKIAVLMTYIAVFFWRDNSSYFNN